MALSDAPRARQRMKAPTIAIVSKARSTYFKPLYEAFAEAQSEPWRTLLVWPSGSRNEHPDELVTPHADNLDLRLVASFLPGREAWRVLQSSDLRGILIHEYSPFTLQALVYAKTRHLPVVVSTEIGRRNAHFFSLRVRQWHNFWGRFVDGIVACCPAAHEPLSGKRVPTTSAYHSVDSRIYTPVGREKRPDEPVVFAYLGRLIHRKGLDLLLKAAAELKSRGATGFKLRFIGMGDEGWLRPLIHQFGMEEHVEMTGFLSGEKLRGALQSADVFVLPTRQDTYGAVAHEAACLGLPLLLSRHAGAAEALVQQERNGFIFTPQNTQSFAGYMERLLNADLRASMAQASREIGETHSAPMRGACLWDWFERNWLRAPSARPELLPERMQPEGR